MGRLLGRKRYDRSSIYDNTTETTVCLIMNRTEIRWLCAVLL